MFVLLSQSSLRNGYSVTDYARQAHVAALERWLEEHGGKALAASIHDLPVDTLVEILSQMDVYCMWWRYFSLANPTGDLVLACYLLSAIIVCGIPVLIVAFSLSTTAVGIVAQVCRQWAEVVRSKDLWQVMAARSLPLSEIEVSRLSSDKAREMLLKNRNQATYHVKAMRMGTQMAARMFESFFIFLFSFSLRVSI